ncbi:hypothetical protein OB981_22475 [Bacillus cereus]|nr:hypothetical protein [Bacillus cereus]
MVGKLGKGYCKRVASCVKNKGMNTANVLQVDKLRKAKRKRNASREEIGRERATMLQDDELGEERRKIL